MRPGAPAGRLVLPSAPEGGESLGGPAITADKPRRSTGLAVSFFSY